MEVFILKVVRGADFRVLVPVFGPQFTPHTCSTIREIREKESPQEATAET